MTTDVDASNTFYDASSDVIENDYLTAAQLPKARYVPTFLVDKTFNISSSKATEDIIQIEFLMR